MALQTYGTHLGTSCPNLQDQGTSCQILLYDGTSGPIILYDEDQETAGSDLIKELQVLYVLIITKEVQ